MKMHVAHWMFFMRSQDLFQYSEGLGAYNQTVCETYPARKETKTPKEKMRRGRGKEITMSPFLFLATLSQWGLSEVGGG